AAGQPGVVYTALEVDVVRRLDLPADVRIGRERWRVSEPDRVVDDLLVRQGCAYLLHEARHVAAPSSIGHRLMRGVVDRGDLFFVSVAHAERHIDVVDIQPAVPVPKLGPGFGDPAPAEG